MMKRLREIAPTVAGMAFLLLLYSAVQAEPAQRTKGVKIDKSAIESPEWQTAIKTARRSASLRSGHGQLTLMRVVLRKAAPDARVQLTSTKLVLPGQGGGGMHQQIRSGEFVLVEHINSTRRKEGRDPVEIGSSTHRHAMIWVDVPPAGELGVLGDVMLSPVPKNELGRITATLSSHAEAEPNVACFRFGPVVVGGPYGDAVPLHFGQTADTGLITPGEYRILLPDFDMVNSRWTVHVEPGTTTRLKFVADSKRQVRLVDQTTKPASAATPKRRNRKDKSAKE